MHIYVRFLLVGGIGFVIDAGLTYLLVRSNVAPWLARIPAILFAMTFTWLSNRYFTYEVKTARSTGEAMRYALVATVMALINYLIYFVLVSLGTWPVAAVTLATACQISISFHAYRRFVFSETTMKLTNYMSQDQEEGASPHGSHEILPIIRSSWRIDTVVFFIALTVLAAAMVYLHALDSGLSGRDEASHFLNGYLIWSYMTEALGQNPLTYATNFYIHYPKISIGHWPPLYYAFLSSFFFFVPQTPFPFMIINLVIGALPALLVARVIRQIAVWPWAFLAGITYVMIPITINNTAYLMVDQAIAGLCLLAALAWSAYVKQPSLWKGMAYAAVTAAAILVKGNGWVLAVFPIIHIVLTQNWRILLNWRTYAAAGAAIIVVGAWTLTTYKISSDGFNYSWGLDYFLLSAPTFLAALYTNLGPLGSLAGLIGIVGCIAAKHRPEIREIGLTCLSLVLATVLFHSIVPVDLEPRYMSSAYPPLVIFMTLGVWMISSQFKRLSVSVLIPISLVVFSIPGLLFLRDRPPRFDMRMDQVAAQITAQQGGMVVVVDGHSGTEGALTAEVALRDNTRQSYVVRSSKLLAKSDFMGKHYQLRVNTPEAVLGLLEDISSTAVVMAEGPGTNSGFPHSDLLLSALRLSSSPFRLVKTYNHLREDGHTYLYLRTTPLVPKHDAVMRINLPEKAPH
jgi:putative flippase GtrA/4-amino-4-deoxy-L-arabinose transferase-like glycosyltransferase